jgi:hypothetical protein
MGRELSLHPPANAIMRAQRTRELDTTALLTWMARPKKVCYFARFMVEPFARCAAIFFIAVLSQACASQRLVPGTIVASRTGPDGEPFRYYSFDVQRVITSVEEGKQAKLRLKQAFDGKQQALSAEEQRLVKLMKELEGLGAEELERRRGSVLEFQERLRSLKDELRSAQAELDAMERSAIGEILRKLAHHITQSSALGPEPFDVMSERIGGKSDASCDLTDWLITSYERKPGAEPPAACTSKRLFSVRASSLESSPAATAELERLNDEHEVVFVRRDDLAEEYLTGICDVSEWLLEQLARKEGAAPWPPTCGPPLR